MPSFWASGAPSHIVVRSWQAKLRLPGRAGRSWVLCLGFNTMDWASCGGGKRFRHALSHTSAEVATVATTPQVPGKTQTTDSTSQMWGGTTRSTLRTPESNGSQPAPRSDEASTRGASFDATVEEIRQRLRTNDFNPLAHLEILGFRRLGLAPKSSAMWLLAALFGVGTRLALALLATVIAGQSLAVPWSRWAVILMFSGLVDATAVVATALLGTPAGERARRSMDDWTALLPTIEHEFDLDDLAAFARRWVRPQVSTAVGAAVAGVVLVACALLAPTGLSELPAGSIVLLILLLVDFGASTVNVFDSAVFTRAAHFDHHLFWPSPADSPEVQRAIRMATGFGLVTGLWVTVYLVLSVVLVSWDSQLVVPLALGFIVIGYLFALASAAGLRSAIQTIVQRSRSQRLERLRRRIEAFEPRFDILTAEESEQARRLIDLHNMIRDSPITPTVAHTLARSAAGLILPTIVFVITVFGEVSAERFLDAILP